MRTPAKYDNFFNTHQRLLLILLNTPRLGNELRRLLWIENDTHRITRISPYSISWALDGKKRAGLFRAGDHHAEALRKNFGRLLKALHAWDMNVANPLVPAWNLGMDIYDENDGANTEDTYIALNSPTTNFGSANTLFVYRDQTSPNEFRSILIKFTDFASTVSGATLDSAPTFSLYNNAQGSIPGTQDVFCVLLRRNWVVNEATHNVYSTGNNWSTAGALNTTTDINSSLLSTLAVTTTVPEFKDWTLDLTQMQAIADGTWTDNGWKTYRYTEPGTFDSYQLRSAEYATPGERPKLYAEYTPPAPPPASANAQPIFF
jgi:hypothetical protein